MKRALITGMTGQDGSYLAELLLEKGYEVYGIVKKNEFNSLENLKNIAHLLIKIKLYPVDIADYESVLKIVEKVQPTECYHFAAQSFTNLTFEEVPLTFETNIFGTCCILEAITKKSPNCRFYFAGSGDMFGNTEKHPQNELTHFMPRNYYAISKIAGHNLTSMYRQNKGLFACCGILFNHESPRRGHIFVTRKISSTVARIFHGSKEKLKLGDLTARRDWGYSPDYVEAMWLMLQQGQPDDYVIGTGETHSVGEFVQKAFEVAGLNWKDHVEIDKTLFRGYEKNILCGDSAKAKSVLGWEPKVKFNELVKIMVEADIKKVKVNP